MLLLTGDRGAVLSADPCHGTQQFLGSRVGRMLSSGTRGWLQGFASPALEPISALCLLEELTPLLREHGFLRKSPRRKGCAGADHCTAAG